MNDLSLESAQTVKALLQRVMVKTWTTKSPSLREAPQAPQTYVLPVLALTAVLAVMLMVALKAKQANANVNANET